MKKLVAVPTIVAGIASFTLGCTDHPPALPSEAAPSRPSFGANTPFNNSGACLGNDAATWHEFVEGMNEPPTSGDLSCVANDVEVSSVVATEMLVNEVWVPIGSGPITCVQGEAITLRLSGTLENSTSIDRLDAGLWLATDGGNAITGSCNHYNLPVNPLPDGVTNSEDVPDSCGDLSGLSSATIDLGAVTVACHAGQSGQLEISACVAWSLLEAERECPVASVSGANGFRAGTLPGNIARCNCQPVVITTAAPQTGSITIVKTVDPADPQDFSFTTTGSGLSSFSLDDDSDDALPKTRTFSSLVAGNYTVTEAATPGFDLTAVTCTAGGSGNVANRTATITVTQGANVTCTFNNAKRATALVNKRENGGLPLSRAWEFEIRTGASDFAPGTVIATGSADLATGVVNFACAPNPNAACENVGGSANLVPTLYQLCEINMPAGYSNNIMGFTPSGSVGEGGINATECIAFSLTAGGAGVPVGVPNPIDNLPPSISGGSIALQTGSFTLVNDALSGDFSIRNSSGGTQQVFVTSLAIVDATFRDGPNLVQATVTGCVYTPLPVSIPAAGTQSIALSGCQVTPSVRKELMFTVRATINGGDQPFYQRTYKVRAQ